jgi:hypothetical protein
LLAHEGPYLPHFQHVFQSYFAVGYVGFFGGEEQRAFVLYLVHYPPRQHALVLHEQHINLPVGDVEPVSYELPHEPRPRKGEVTIGLKSAVVARWQHGQAHGGQAAQVIGLLKPLPILAILKLPHIVNDLSRLVGGVGRAVVGYVGGHRSGVGGFFVMVIEGG